MRCFASSALHAEALVVLHALIWARTKSWSSVRILSDYHNLVSLLQRPDGGDVSLLWTLQHIRSMIFG